MQVTIDGVPYAPVCNSGSRIGIAITTYNRPAVLANTIEQHLKPLPAGAKLIVIDDGSAPAATAFGIEIIRHDKSLGIVASKNRSLEELIDAGCEHLFLWDDDAYPCYSLVGHADGETVECHPDNQPRIERRRAWRLSYK